MKRGYTLLELIFVISIIGVLTGVGFYNFKPAYLQNDANFVAMKLHTTRYEALSFDKALHDLGSGYSDSIGCIELSTLNQNSSTIDKNYKFHATLSISPSLNILCFDTLGRLHDGEQDSNATTGSSLLGSDINITLNYNSKNISLLLDHSSGNIRFFY